jgi:hypothetical protein
MCRSTHDEGELKMSVQQAVEEGMSVEEMIANGISKKDAEFKMAVRTFGEGAVQVDRQGRLVITELGRGSAANPCEQSFTAIEKYEGKAAADAARAAAAKRKGAL